MRALIDGVKAIKKSVCTPFLPACRPRTGAPSGAHCAGHDVHSSHRVLQVLDEAAMATGPNKPFHSQMYTFVTKAASQASRPKPPKPRLGPPPHLRRALAHLLAVGLGPGAARPRLRWDSATSALGLGHDRAGTRPHLRWDSATSALGLGHVYAGTARRWRSWRRRALGCARGAPLRMSCHVPVSASHHLCPFVRRRCASSA